MIVIDTSVIVAIALNEPDEAELLAALLSAPERLISAASILEATMRLSRSSEDPVGLVERFVADRDLAIVPVDLEQLRAAQLAFLRFGKGRHPAGLNFGDCFVYALAKTRRASLLFKGTDFGSTDVLAYSR